MRRKRTAPLLRADYPAISESPQRSVFTPLITWGRSAMGERSPQMILGSLNGSGGYETMALGSNMCTTRSGSIPGSMRSRPRYCRRNFLGLTERMHVAVTLHADIQPVLPIFPAWYCRRPTITLYQPGIFMSYAASGGGKNKRKWRGLQLAQ